MIRQLHITSQEQLEQYYQKFNKPIRSLTEFIAVLEYRWTMQIIYFRGEPQLYETPCLPSIWRSDEYRSQNNETKSEPWTDLEQDLITKFQRYVREGRLNDPYFDSNHAPDSTSVEWLGLAQHYGCPTRLLDVTLDPLVALYFAVSNDTGKDGRVYLSNGSSLNTLDPGEYDNNLSNFFRIYKLRDCSPKNETLFLYRPLANNRRMISQRGQFVWCRAVNHPLRATDAQLIISGDSKIEIKKTLARLGYSSNQLLPPAFSSNI